MCLSRLSMFRALYATRVFIQNAWTRAMSISLFSGFSFNYVSLWAKQVDEDMRAAGSSDEFAQSIYEYKVKDGSRKVGVDLVQFYQLRLDQKNFSHAERNQPLLQLNILEKMVLRLLTVRANFKLRYNM